MVSAGVPFIGVPTVCLPDVTEEIVGPPVGIQAASALRSGESGPVGAHEGVPLGLIGRTAMSLLRGWVGGDHRASPFFDRETRAAISTPEVMEPETRARLREA